MAGPSRAAPVCGRAPRGAEVGTPVRVGNAARPIDLGCWPPTSSVGGGLPRKEVIQPHLPVRLPCYDFVPIAGPALDGCPPVKG